MESDRESLTLAECVEIIVEGEAVRKKPPILGNCGSALVILQESSNKNGLSEEQIIQLVQVTASSKYTDAVATSIIKCLIPRNCVPADCFVKIVSWMCAKMLSVNLQVSFLKWLILVYKWIDDKAIVYSLYGILFLFLDNDALCPYICHLLYLMTTKDDVKPFRLRKLTDLLGKVGAQPHLLGLLSLYKVYSPHLVAINVPKTRKAFFKRKDAKWLDIVWRVQSLRRTKREEKSSSVLNKDSFLCMPAAKRRKKNVIVPPFRLHGTDNRPSDGSHITVNQIKTFQEFLDHFDKLEFPNQMGTVLESRYLQHLLLCTGDKQALLRLNFWLYQTLHEELVSAPSGGTSERVAKFLESLLNFVCVIKSPNPAVEICLAEYLFTWNGVDYQPQILLLVSQLRVQPFHKLNDLILEPLRKLFFSSSVQFKCQILSCFLEMLLNLANFALSLSPKEELSDISTKIPLSNVTDLPKVEAAKRKTSQLLREFIQFVDKICAVALQVESDHVLLQHWILCFFEQASILRQQYDVHFVCIPSSAVVYRLLFASNSMAISRLCKLIVSYKGEFESLKRAEANNNVSTSFDGFDSISQFNHYILDISDTIWRNKAFVDRTKSLCYSIPRPVTDALEVPFINERFSILNHVAFVAFAKTFLVETQPEGIKLNPNLVRGKIRTVYLEFLRRHNLHGVIAFLDTFIIQKVS